VTPVNSVPLHLPGYFMYVMVRCDWRMSVCCTTRSRCQQWWWYFCIYVSLGV